MFRRLRTHILAHYFNSDREIKDSIQDKSHIFDNVFNRNYAKKALLSFITSPFNEQDIGNSHTNKLEAYTIAEILNELKFNVDVVNFNEKIFIPKYEYDLILGFGQPIEDLLFSVKKINFKLILYRNGTEASVSDKIALKRIYQLHKNKGVLLLDSSRIYPLQWKAQHYFADKIIALGNDFVADSYMKNTNASVTSLNLFYFDVGAIDLTKKDFKKAKQNFLWFGSAGAVHKGLDLLLEYFKKHPELNLYVCGLNQTESKFWEVYKDYFQLNNIKNLGFINLLSTEFNSLMYKCGAIISPTVSEGGGGAVLNVIAAGGLIPITTKNQGLDFNNEEVLISDFTQDAIDLAILKYQTLADIELLEKSKRLLAFIRKEHTFDSYKSKLKNLIIDTLNIEK